MDIVYNKSNYYNVKKLLRAFSCFALRSLRMSKKLFGLNCFTDLSAVAA
jgi:hypothetical protein